MTTITPSSRLEDLAAKCEQATAGCVKETAALMAAADELAKQGLIPSEGWDRFIQFLNVGAYFDAAMTMAPKGRAALVLQQSMDACLTATHHRADDFTRRLPAFVSAAALRAHAKLSVLIGNEGVSDDLP